MEARDLRAVLPDTDMGAYHSCGIWDTRAIRKAQSRYTLEQVAEWLAALHPTQATFGFRESLRQIREGLEQILKEEL